MVTRERDRPTPTPDAKALLTPKSSPQTVNITISLEDLPTALHQAGLAGLHLSLTHLNHLNGQLVSWELSQNSITLISDKTDKEAVEWLLQNTYHTNHDGLITIPALGDLDINEQISLHQGMMGTFISHPIVIKSTKGIVAKSQPIDENQSIEFTYKALDYYPHQDLNSLKAFNKKGEFKSPVKIVSWLYPGGNDLHIALGGRTKLEETLEGLIALAFAPIACSYYKIKSRLRQEKYLWALVIPEIGNLEAFTQAKRKSGSQLIEFDRYYASGMSDASLRELTRLAGEKVIDSLPVNSCEVWAFGSRPWSKQLVITAKQRIELNFKLSQLYSLCQQCFRGQLKKTSKNGTFVSVSFGSEIATENMINGKNWYAGLHQILSWSTEYHDLLNYEWRFLHNMKEQTIENGFVSNNATVFCDGITWIYKELLGQAFSNVRSSGNTPNLDRVRQDVQLSIRSIKTKEQFIRWFTELISKPTNAKNPFWQGLNLAEFQQWILSNWEECLSLTALAVMTYKNPWDVERTRNILLSKGFSAPLERGNLKVVADSNTTVNYSDNYADIEPLPVEV